MRKPNDLSAPIGLVPSKAIRLVDASEFAEELTTPNESDLSDLELLASALTEAMDAHENGLVLGLSIDEVALHRAARRARRADTRQLLTSVIPGGAA